MNTTLVRDFSAYDEALNYQQQSIALLSEQVSTAHQKRFDAVQNVSVIGAGAMGRCIAIAFARLGKKVVVVDSFTDSLQTGEQFIKNYIAGQVGKGRLSEAAATELQQLFVFSDSYEQIADADLIVEAVPEVLTLKQDVMREIASQVSENCILATNTSTLDLDQIAAVVPNPERVVGTHFFIPAHVTKLLEIIPAKQTSELVVGAMKAMALAMKKVFVIAGNCDGFIGNRLFDRFHQEAMYLLEEGATPEQVDTVLEQWGMAIGPLRALDMVGNDIPWQVRCQRKERNPQIIQPTIGDRLCEQGFYGQKSGVGWYRYAEGSRTAQVDEGVLTLLNEVSAELGIQRRTISDDEILGRCLLSLVNEGCAIVREGFAQSMTEIDLAFVNGYGFPAKFGGPLFLARSLGVARVAEEMERYQSFASYGDQLWLPDSLLMSDSEQYLPKTENMSA